MNSLGEFNRLAKYSCPRWNPVRLSRIIYRWRLHYGAMHFWRTCSEQRDLSERYIDGEMGLNTYPWPYGDEGFANWDEDDSNENYSLVSDQSGCVVKYSTSYCAWKIFELTGRWPKKKTRERLDAKRWIQFLYEAGYPVVLDSPAQISESGHYVGVNKDYGEFGLVVWFEGTNHNDPSLVNVSTYINKKFYFGFIDPKKYIWVKIR